MSEFKPVSGESSPSTQQWYQRSVEESLAALNSSPSGLKEADAQTLLLEHGPNALPQKKPKSLFVKFISHFKDVLIYVLLAAAIVTAIMGHWVDTLVILGVAVINALIGFIQENNAEKSLKSIQNMLSSEALVVRGGQHITISTEHIVPGDIVMLRPGDRIPADLRLIDIHNLRVEEAILTGESTVVSKKLAALEGEKSIGDRKNLAFSGTTVSSGTASGVVIATGGDTELGHINEMLSSINENKTPLLVQMDKLGKAIFAIILLMMVALLIFGWMLRDIPFAELLLSVISLAVAAVPEGLPAIISIILSLGVQAMARNQAIIRKLPTVETLGAMSVICSDKTGTLTMNEMTVKAVILADKVWRVEGSSYEPRGDFYPAGASEAATPNTSPVFTQFLRTVDICNESQLRQDDHGHWVITGGPTEGALKVLAAKAQLDDASCTIGSKIPFDSLYKYMAVACQIDGEAQVLLTGAPDVLLRLCQSQQQEDGVVPLDLAYWENAISTYASEGLRMVAAARKPVEQNLTSLDHPDLQQGLVLLGIAGMMDPPRPEAIAAIEQCQQAGIRVKMITGDHQETAMAIGQMLGIGNSASSITGYQLEHMDDRELQTVAQEYDIFARTSPEHKLRLVKALQETGAIVGMTGDGVNDAPALKQANVGIAMGIKGTEVTKESADMILADDNFATIASAVKEGRRVYDNLKKTILFIMPTNLAQGLLIIIAILMGNLLPLTPVQILWMNMATSATLSFGLAFEPAERNAMRRPPRNVKSHVMDGYAIWRVVFVGLLISISAFILEAWLEPRGYSTEFIRTVLLQMLVTAQWVYMINCRDSEHFSLNAGLLKNKGIWLVTLVLIALQALIIYVPLMNTLFGTRPLPFSYWIISLMIGAMLFVVVEIEKKLTRNWRK
ncbi:MULTISPECIES: cation-transporting P-type ATPase [Winslowiella]|uniref:cation-transporting P-type ATPase n=1 Tax=Winslowiella TaxID=2997349 RepID=UPI0028BE8370|nr:cation-transporting P-type ATPase [Winslowiella toletana]WNN45283.1 cation-transporting P-type ATPase [Winslowiella toletana]